MDTISRLREAVSLARDLEVLLEDIPPLPAAAEASLVLIEDDIAAVRRKCAAAIAALDHGRRIAA